MVLNTWHVLSCYQYRKYKRTNEEEAGGRTLFPPACPVTRSCAQSPVCSPLYPVKNTLPSPGPPDWANLKWEPINVLGCKGGWRDIDQFITLPMESVFCNTNVGLAPYTLGKPVCPTYTGLAPYTHGNYLTNNCEASTSAAFTSQNFSWLPFYVDSIWGSSSCQFVFFLQDAKDFRQVTGHNSCEATISL